jgi:nitroimidazol reductase NimA-like FMN-containing flavoprotein (pyridoxamine 5'-phosphate oxidase superfamily)
MYLKMTQAEREAFLKELHVGVISVEEPGRGPLTVPIWYDYDGDRNELWVLTGENSRKGRLLKAAERFSLVVQSEQPPLYKYVSVEGPVVSTRKADRERDSRPMARRYFGDALGDQYIDSSSDETSLVFTMRPERWLTVDYSKASG